MYKKYYARLLILSVLTFNSTPFVLAGPSPLIPVFAHFTYLSLSLSEVDDETLLYSLEHRIIRDSEFIRMANKDIEQDAQLKKMLMLAKDDENPDAEDSKEGDINAARSGLLKYLSDPKSTLTGSQQLAIRVLDEYVFSSNLSQAELKSIKKVLDHQRVKKVFSTNQTKLFTELIEKNLKELEESELKNITLSRGLAAQYLSFLLDKFGIDIRQDAELFESLYWKYSTDANFERLVNEECRNDRTLGQNVLMLSKLYASQKNIDEAMTKIFSLLAVDEFGASYNTFQNLIGLISRYMDNLKSAETYVAKGVQEFLYNNALSSDALLTLKKVLQSKSFQKLLTKKDLNTHLKDLESILEDETPVVKIETKDSDQHWEDIKKKVTNSGNKKSEMSLVIKPNKSYKEWLNAIDIIREWSSNLVSNFENIRELLDNHIEIFNGEVEMSRIAYAQFLLGINEARETLLPHHIKYFNKLAYNLPYYLDIGILAVLVDVPPIMASTLVRLSRPSSYPDMKMQYSDLSDQILDIEAFRTIQWNLNEVDPLAKILRQIARTRLTDIDPTKSSMKLGLLMFNRLLNEDPKFVTNHALNYFEHEFYRFALSALESERKDFKPNPKLSLPADLISKSMNSKSFPTADYVLSQEKLWVETLLSVLSDYHYENIFESLIKSIISKKVDLKIFKRWPRILFAADSKRSTMTGKNLGEQYEKNSQFKKVVLDYLAYLKENPKRLFLALQNDASLLSIFTSDTNVQMKDSPIYANLKLTKLESKSILEYWNQQKDRVDNPCIRALLASIKSKDQ